MNLIKLPLVKRTAQIVQVLYKNGLITKEMASLPKAIGRISKKPIAMGVGVLPEPSVAGSNRELGRRIRQAFEDLGPTFIKLGQLLSMRPDLVEPAIVKELALLQDQVRPFPSMLLDQLVEEELGRKPLELFREFNYEPVASASIAQVHQAVLATGEKVALKIQRPKLVELVNQDIAALKYLTPYLNKSVIGRVCKVKEVVKLFARQIHSEMDFNKEALNMENFKATLAAKADIKVPRVYWQYSTKKILTLEYMEGMKLDQFLATAPKESLRLAFGKGLINAVLEPFFTRGVFHGDPHPGNLLFTSQEELILLDYGIVGRLDHEFRYQAALLLTALKNYDVNGMISVICTLGSTYQEIDSHLLFEDASQLMDVVQGADRGDISFSKVIYGMIDMAITHGIYLPSSFYLFGKALVTTEAVARRLHPNLSLIQEISLLAQRHLQGELQPEMASEQLMLNSVAAIRELRSSPLQLSKLLEKLADGKQQVLLAHKDLDPLVNSNFTSSGRVSQAIITVGLLISGAILLSFGANTLSTTLGVGSMALAGLLIVRTILAKERTK
ncbi:MAG: AarF/UbiB family protein [Bacillota bacterium]|nr:AarF/UbiB family protein [Bacillota bacterium]